MDHECLASRSLSFFTGFNFLQQEQPMTVPGQFDHIIGELTKFPFFEISQIESILVMTIHCRILNRLLLNVLRAKLRTSG